MYYVMIEKDICRVPQRNVYNLQSCGSVHERQHWSVILCIKEQTHGNCCTEVTNGKRNQKKMDKGILFFFFFFKIKQKLAVEQVWNQAGRRKYE